MPSGRPTSYKQEYCEEILKYFSIAPYQEIGGQLVASDFPSYAGFAAKIRVNRDTLKEWCKLHEEFSAAYKLCKELQENFVIVNGNKGLLNTAFGIFTAKNVLGWRDKQPDEVDVVVNNVAHATREEIEREARQIAREMLQEPQEKLENK